MAQARSQETWNHTSSILALIANAHRDPRKHRAFKPQDFHPHVRAGASAPAVKVKGLSILKTVFVRDR